jgi:hypothetical protein
MLLLWLILRQELDSSKFNACLLFRDMTFKETTLAKLDNEDKIKKMKKRQIGGTESGRG